MDSKTTGYLQAKLSGSQRTPTAPQQGQRRYGDDANFDGGMSRIIDDEMEVCLHAKKG
jgi:hypothetical protein